MSAAAMQQTVPLFEEGRRFWDDLAADCRRLTDAMNRAVLSGGGPADQLIRCDIQDDIHLFKEGLPSTHVNVHLNFRSWGPILCTVIGGEQKSGRKFTSSELEIPIARDLDGSVIAIYDEGRSFSTQDLTRFLLQNFRRCFPAISLPCERALP